MCQACLEAINVTFLPMSQKRNFLFISRKKTIKFSVCDHDFKCKIFARLFGTVTII